MEHLHGATLNGMYLLHIKAPEASAEPWDYYDLVATVAGDDALPMA